MALGMVMNGARGASFDEMRAALRFGSLDQPTINNAYKSLMPLLYGLDPATTISIANSAWFDTSLPLNPAFASSAQDYFGAQVTSLNFGNANAASTINTWVNERTSGRIPTIVGGISPDVRFFLLNAIYFKGRWRNEFDPAATRPGTFTLANGSTKSVDMMMVKTNLATNYLDGAWLVDLPYGNGAFVLTAVLPPNGVGLDTWIRGLTSARWKDLRGGSGVGSTTVYFPRAKLEFDRTLNADLKALGMSLPFSGAADFSGLSTTALSLGEVKQKTFMEINEEGTEAAVATSVMGVTSVGGGGMRISFDEPFLLILRERLSGTVLFAAKIHDP